MRFVTEVAVRFVDMQIKETFLWSVFEIVQIDAVLHFELQNSLASTTTNDIHVTPNIRNL